MKQIYSLISIILITLSLTTSAQAQARQGNLGLGFILGSPTALSAKHFMSDQRAIDFGLAFSNDDYILLYGDYLIHKPGMFRTESAFINSLVPYFGVGPLIAFGTGDYNRNNGRRQYFDDNHDDDFALGIRVPFGVEWMASEFPLGVALELAPGIVVIPGTDGFINAGLALRYYF